MRRPMTRGPSGVAGWITAYPVPTFLIAATVIIYFTYPAGPAGPSGSDATAGALTDDATQKPPRTHHNAPPASVRDVLKQRGCDPRAATRYGLMLDAGSTGSRIHVFEFDYHDYPNIKLKREVFEELRPGLSSYKSDAKGAANSLKPLMDVAVREVPKDLVKCTPVELKATAGLRLLGPEKSAAILTAVDALLRSYPFAVGADAAIVMDGKDEGPYAWLTVNFLLGTLQSDSITSAVIDMGGASTQIVFVPEASSSFDRKASPNRYDVTLATGVTFSMYQHSHLGYGLKESFKAIDAMAPAAAAAGSAAGGTFPCRFDATNGGAADFDSCLTYASKHLKKDAPCTHDACSFNGVFQPPLSKHKGPIYAFSYYYDRLEQWLPEGGATTVGFVKEVGRGICKAADAKYKSYAKGTMCTDLTYLYALLSQGYGLDDSTGILVKKKINDIETAWPLGAMILAM